MACLRAAGLLCAPSLSVLTEAYLTVARHEASIEQRRQFAVLLTSLHSPEESTGHKPTMSSIMNSDAWNKILPKRSSGADARPTWCTSATPLCTLLQTSPLSCLWGQMAASHACTARLYCRRHRLNFVGTSAARPSLAVRYTSQSAAKLVPGPKKPADSRDSVQPFEHNRAMTNDVIATHL